MPNKTSSALYGWQVENMNTVKIISWQIPAFADRHYQSQI